MPRTDLVVIRKFPTKFDAEMAKSALEAANIDAMIRADDAGGVQPGMWLGNGVELLVRSEDAERATEILTTRPHADSKGTLG